LKLEQNDKYAFVNLVQEEEGKNDLDDTVSIISMWFVWVSDTFLFFFIFFITYAWSLIIVCMKIFLWLCFDSINKFQEKQMSSTNVVVVKIPNCAVHVL